MSPASALSAPARTPAYVPRLRTPKGHWRSRLRQLEAEGFALPLPFTCHFDPLEGRRQHPPLAPGLVAFDRVLRSSSAAPPCCERTVMRSWSAARPSSSMAAISCPNWRCPAAQKRLPWLCKAAWLNRLSLARWPGTPPPPDRSQNRSPVQGQNSRAGRCAGEICVSCFERNPDEND